MKYGLLRVKNKLLERLVKYRHVDKEEAKIRLSHQLSQDEKIKRGDVILWNNGNKKRPIPKDMCYTGEVKTRRKCMAGKEDKCCIEVMGEMTMERSAAFFYAVLSFDWKRCRRFVSYFNGDCDKIKKNKKSFIN